MRFLSFYPIFPSPPGTKRLDPLNLDMTHFDLVKMQTGPDIIIAPSVQKAFTRVSLRFPSSPRVRIQKMLFSILLLFRFLPFCKTC